MIDDKTSKYFTNTQRELVDEFTAFSQDPDLHSLINGFALFEARLRSEIDSKEDVLPNFLLGILAPELLGTPPGCGVLSVMGPGGTNIAKYSELLADDLRWRTSSPAKLTGATIRSSKIKFQPYNCLILEISKAEAELLVYIDADLMTSQAILADIMRGGCTIMNFTTGAVIGEIVFFPDINLADNTLNPFQELYDYKWLKVKYNFFKLVLNHFEDTMLIAIKTDGLLKQLPEGIFKLNCIPIASLFKTTASPIKILPEQLEYDCVTPYQQYRIEEVILLDSEVKLVAGKDYFISKSNKLAFPTRPINKIALIKLLCTQSQPSHYSKFIFEDLNYLQGHLIKYIGPEPVGLVSKWTILKLYNQNLFYKHYQENKLLDFVRPIMEMLNENTHINGINVIDDVSIVKKGGYSGMIKTATIDIHIDLSVTSLVLALVWSRILIQLLPFNIKGRVIIRDTNGIIEEIHGSI
jgi:hypothetical protein